MSLKARKKRYPIRKTVSMVLAAIASSKLQLLGSHQGCWDDKGMEEPVPKVLRPNARRKIWSMCARAGDEVGGASELSDVLDAGKGIGMCVARNMW